nr:beta-galactosidase trimerization domain-containing protein [Leuconostoc mesenteroides]
MVDNESLTATSSDWIEFAIGKDVNYNDVFRRLYDTFYKLNVRTDLNPKTINLSDYALVVVPMLYVSDETFLKALNQYIHDGGNVLFTFKDGVTDEHVKVRTDIQPAIIREAVGAHYHMFVDPNGETLEDQTGIFEDTDLHISEWAELLESDGATILASYNNHWKNLVLLQKTNMVMVWHGI